jgi:citronellol/citronellal dehydrogenase
MAADCEAAKLLRPGLLRGTGVLLAGGGAGAGSCAGTPLLTALAGALAELEAKVCECEALAPDGTVAEERIHRAVDAALRGEPPVRRLVVDGAGLFSGAGGGRVGMRMCLEAGWSVTRALVNEGLIPGGEGGRITYIAPAPSAGEHADATRAGLENLSRTLSIEWARHGMTAVTIAPGDTSTPAELAALAAYLASPAGAYFSGCLLDLRGPDRGARAERGAG